MVETKLKRCSLFILALTITVAMILPFYWAASLSIRSPQEAYTVTGLAVPIVQYQPTLDNWRTELSTGETQRALATSCIIAAGAVLAALLLGTPAAYALARFQFNRPSNHSLTLWFLSQRILPPVATAIPFYLMMPYMKLLDTRTAMIILNATFSLPLAVVIMRQAFLDLPVELEDAARVDGAGHFGSFVRICLPLAAPSLMATALIVIAFSWNEFLFALMIGFRDAKVIPVHMAGAVTTRGVDFWCLSVRAPMAMLPPVVLALFSQRYLVRGLTFGALKG